MQMEVPSPQKTLGNGGASIKSVPLKIVDAGGWRSRRGLKGKLLETHFR